MAVALTPESFVFIASQPGVVPVMQIMGKAFLIPTMLNA
jgi:hypothetical protein